MNSKKHILITGSTDGLGKDVALQLAKHGHHVYVHGRKLEKVNSVVDEIRTESKNSTVRGFCADFQDLAQVEELAGTIIQEVSHLDVLINNAGVLRTTGESTSYGVDVRMVVNYFAPYLLTKKITPLLLKSGTKLLNISSAAQSEIDYAAFFGQKNCRKWKRTL